MSIPENFNLDDGGYFENAGMFAIVAVVFNTFVCGISVFLGHAPLRELILPFAALSVIWVALIGFNLAVGALQRFSDRRAVRRLFEGSIWEQWQFRAAEWQKIVDAEYRIMVPEDGPPDYLGAVYSSGCGVILAVCLILVGYFFIKDPQAMPIIWVCATAIFLLLLGIGIFQPMQIRYKARQYCRRALRVPEPRVWFSSEGIYHETLGYTSLKELAKITDQTRTRRAIKFTLVQKSENADCLVPVSFAVPSGYEEQAARLVKRYRQERLNKE